MKGRKKKGERNQTREEKKLKSNRRDKNVLHIYTKKKGKEKEKNRITLTDVGNHHRPKTTSKNFSQEKIFIIFFLCFDCEKIFKKKRKKKKDNPSIDPKLKWQSPSIDPELKKSFLDDRPRAQKYIAVDRPLCTGLVQNQETANYHPMFFFFLFPL